MSYGRSSIFDRVERTEAVIGADALGSVKFCHRGYEVQGCTESIPNPISRKRRAIDCRSSPRGPMLSSTFNFAPLRLSSLYSAVSSPSRTRRVNTVGGPLRATWHSPLIPNGETKRALQPESQEPRRSQS